jgi:hypothetical protein
MMGSFKLQVRHSGSGDLRFTSLSTMVGWQWTSYYNGSSYFEIKKISK